MKKFCAAAMIVSVGMIFLSCFDDDSETQSSLEGYWDMVSFTDSGGTTEVTSGTAIIHFHNGSHEHYYSLGTPGCNLGTYTVSGNRITYNTGTVDAYSVTEASLRLTTVEGGPPFDKEPGDYSDFIRLTSFDPAPYGTCK